MGDVTCAKCGDPWDRAEIYPAVQGDEDCALTPDEARRFLAGDGCPSCKFGRTADNCGHCKGKGVVDFRQEMPSLRFTDYQPESCPSCGGTGKRAAEQASEERFFDFLESATEETDEPEYVLDAIGF